MGQLTGIRGSNRCKNCLNTETVHARAVAYAHGPLNQSDPDGCDIGDICGAQCFFSFKCHYSFCFRFSYSFGGIFVLTLTCMLLWYDY